MALEMTHRAQRLLYFAGTDRCSCPVVCLAFCVMGSMAILAVFVSEVRVCLDAPRYPHQMSQMRLHFWILQCGAGGAHVAALICHWFYARQKRFRQSSSQYRANRLPPTGIRSEIWVWLCCGILLCPIINFYELKRVGPQDRGWHIWWLTFVLASLVSFIQLLIIVLPAALPHIATTLLLQEDLKHLSHELLTFVQGGNLEMCSGLLEDVSKTRSRWRCFLRWHFALEGATLVFFALQMRPSMLRMGGSDFTSAVGPMAAVYLVMQIQCLARFNATISSCKETTQNEAIFRWMWQNESKLEFRVFGLIITHTKIKAFVTSLVFTGCSKAAIYLARW